MNILKALIYNFNTVFIVPTETKTAPVSSSSAIMLFCHVVAESLTHNYLQISLHLTPALSSFV
jgi:hypothetical protein